MKLFLREYASYILVYILNFSILFFFYGKLGGFISKTNMGYFIFLSNFLLFCFLAYKYLMNRELYKRLINEPEDLDDTLSFLGSSPLAIATSNSFKQQYRLYQKEIQDYSEKQKEHLYFINQWVHQMKTPLSVIGLIVQENETEPYMGSIKDELERLDRGLNMALYLARLDTFGHDFHVDKVYLRSSVIEVINSMKRYFIRKKVFPQIDMEEDLFVYSDMKWLGFMLEQIITNGVKYSYMKSDKIYIKAYKKFGKTILEVIDRGVGIPKKDIRRVMEPFYTGENGRKFGESTGMGLYIVHEICKGLSHDINIESEVGVGTTIKIIFN
ncbi:sensor histidine kinase [Anaerosalibacter massiliensis]|uniref:histidine kinase n=1 Tax=Anaerosalibacter massiliensis TaxID=1347392 RepID=A0A9X2MI58_9FIRM|nr:sensor histidine kinase [Anaerosalibacter massiliensis]MCR2043617.1 sensor histidine kinase [Anaerosalibacter massiliensis]